MKQIINGKKYDTETAREIGADSYNGSTRDFAFWREVLYCKRNGEYFLFGEGGPMSRYASSSDGGRSWGWGDDIVPMSEDEARDWAEKHMNADEYEAEFGEVSADVDFAARIKAMRTEANLTQQGYADVLGVDRTTVARWELGRNEPAAYVIDLIEYKLRMQGYIK